MLLQSSLNVSLAFQLLCALCSVLCYFLMLFHLITLEKFILQTQFKATTKNTPQMEIIS